MFFTVSPTLELQKSSSTAQGAVEFAQKGDYYVLVRQKLYRALLLKTGQVFYKRHQQYLMAPPGTLLIDAKPAPRYSAEQDTEDMQRELQFCWNIILTAD